MSKGDTTENDFMKFTFNKNAISWDANTQLFISLHTTPGVGEAGNQTTNEATYTGYTRVAVQRQGGYWTVATNQAQNTSTISFPQCAGLTNTITDVAIGTLFSGTGQVLYYGTLGNPLTVSNLIQPQFAPLQLTISED